MNEDIVVLRMLWPLSIPKNAAQDFPGKSVLLLRFCKVDGHWKPQNSTMREQESFDITSIKAQ